MNAKHTSNFNIKVILTLLIIIVGTISCGKGNNREAAIYLLPENYVGSFYVIYNAPKGQPPKYEGDSRVYEIPTSGILITQMKPNEGWIDSHKLQYYYLSKDGSREQITDRWTTSFEDSPESREDKTVYIFGGGLGEIEPLMGCTAIEQGFGVGTKTDMLDGKNFFDTYDARGIKSIDKSIFDGMCPDRDIQGYASIHLLPENYKGTFYMFFGIKNGQPVKYEDGMQVFDIPESGILMTQAQPNDALPDSPKLQYYYVDNNGSRTPLTARWPLDSAKEDEQITILISSISELLLKKGCSVHTQRISVGTKTELLNYSFQIDMNKVDKTALEASCFKSW